MKNNNIELNKISEDIKGILYDVVKAKSMKEQMVQGKDESDEDYAKRIKNMKHDETTDKSEELSDEDISKSYESDNEEEDNWDNIEKACWSGYKQVGMKDKGGRRVPNFLPVKKSLFGTEGPQTLIPRNK